MKKLFTLFAVAALAFAAQANVLSVCQGEYQSSYVPVYGLWYDTPGFNQMIYPADMLAEMADGDITEVSFLTLGNVDGTPYGQDFSGYTLNFSGGELTLALKEVDQIGFTETVYITDAQIVSTLVPEAGGYFLTFALDEPFHYNGGNLLVEVNVQVPGNYASTYFWGMGFYDENDEVIYTPTYMYNENYYGDANVNQLSAFLPAADFTYEAGTEPGPDPEDPYAEGYWLMAINADGEVVPYQLMLGDNGDYTTTVKFGYNDFGTYDPETEERPAVPFFFIVNGVRYGAPEELVAATLGYALDNPLAAADGCYTVPVGFNYNIGIAFGLEGDMYAYVAQANSTGIDELSGKAVSGVRYFNLAGQEMQQANGVTIVVTTYTDGTTSAVKVVK